jgi:hypothetical protein
MKRSAVYGVGRGINGREAAMQATQHALDQLGASRPVLALAFVSQEYNTTEVINGLMGLLGDTPMWGFSTIRPVTDEGEQPRSVVVALLTGSDLKAQVQWWPNYSQDSSGTARQIAQSLRQETFLSHDILFVADGINGNLGPFCQAVENIPMGITGCMAAGEQALGKTYQIGKNQSGPGSLSLALLGGRFRVGAGVAHGWRSVGAFFRATRTRDVWVQALDGLPAIESYMRYFGHSQREWAAPPLNEMARLYPLGVETEAGSSNLLVRSALRVEVDGSLRMSAPVPEGAVVHLMIGDPSACLEAAQLAAQTALRGLNNAKPMLAIALLDVAWGYLFETHPKQVTSALKQVLGDVPLIGAYTLGQVTRPSDNEALNIYNQNMVLVVIGEAAE